MKKFVSKICMLLFIFMTLMVSLTPIKVNAAEQQKDPKVVSYYQAIVKEDGDQERLDALSGITAISQFYYKNQGTIGDDSGSISARTTGKFVDLTSTKCSEVFGTGSAFCNDDTNRINPTLARVTITNHGDVEVYVANGVIITNLRIYYIVANHSNVAQLFCNSTGSICEGAKKINKNSLGITNWRNEAKGGGVMTYSSSTMDQHFTKHVIGQDQNSAINQETGAKRYDGFNITTEMNTTYVTYAKKYGVYVTTALTIQYENTNYYLNANVNDNIFSSVDNLTNSALSYTNVCRSDYVTNDSTKGCDSSYTSVSQIALLTKMPPEEDVSGNKAYKETNRFIDDTVIPVAKIVIIMLFLVVGTTTIVNIVKSSDEPEVRRGQIKKLVAMFVSAVVIYVILIFYKDIIEAVSGWFG